MRGLVLREISLRHWPKVLYKELKVGLLNGLAVAATTALGVYVWSRSLGLVVVIALSMVISMVVAGFAGAMVPITLQRFGLDIAQSSSIILTTFTDVVGFSSSRRFCRSCSNFPCVSRTTLISRMTVSLCAGQLSMASHRATASSSHSVV
jgi:hypothetical protein